MKPDEKQTLKRTAKLAQENNEIIKKIHKSMKMARLIKTIYWLVIIGVAVGLFVYLQPLVTPLFDAYHGIIDKLGGIGEFVDRLKAATPEA